MARVPVLTVRIGSCTPESLATLGPTLCMYLALETHVLTGLTLATSVHPWISIGVDGPCEALTFFDSAQRPCWRLFLLPDSDYCAWDAMVAGLDDPVQSDGAMLSNPGDWTGIRRIVGSPVWKACALQMHALPEPNAPCRLAASQVLLSEVGQRAAQRIARSACASFPAAHLSPALR